MNKRLIIIIGSIIACLVILGLLLALAVKKQKQTAPTAQNRQVTKVLDQQVLWPAVSYDNNTIWYFNTDGRLFSIKSDGSALSEFPLPALAASSIRQALWPKTGHDFITISGTPPNQTASFYDSAKKIYINLAKNIRSLDWMPDGRRVAYIWQSSDNIHQQLVVANSDGTGFRKVADVFWPDLNVKVSPDGKTALLWRSQVQDLNKIYTVDLETGTFGTVVAQGKNLGAIWVSDTKFIYAQDSGTASPKLFVYDLSSNKSQDLGLATALNKIFVDKEGKMLYAAVSRKDSNGDIFIKLDLSSLIRQVYLDSSDTRGNSLFLVGNSVYFVNTKDGKLYKIE